MDKSNLVDKLLEVQLYNALILSKLDILTAKVESMSVGLEVEIGKNSRSSISIIDVIYVISDKFLKKQKKN